MKFLFFLLFFSLSFFCFSQNSLNSNIAKPNLDTSVFSNWPSLKRFGISKNGEFAYFTIKEKKNEYLLVKSLLTNWQENVGAIKTSSIIKFTNNCKSLCFLKPSDTMCMITLDTIDRPDIKYFSPVRSFDLLSNNETEYLIYQLNSPAKDLIAKDLKNGKQVLFKNVNEYLINYEKSQLILKIDSLINGEQKEILSWSNVDDPTCNNIIQGNKLSNLLLNEEGNELAFIKEDHDLRSIWYYKFGSNELQHLADSCSGIDKKLDFEKIIEFNKDGSKIFCYLKEKSFAKPKQGYVKVNVWSFTDTLLQSIQLNNTAPKKYLAVINLNDHKVTRLQYENDKIIPTGNKTDSFIYLINQEGDDRELWNSTAKSKAFLVSIDDGRRTELKISFKSPKISPDAKYLIGHDETWANIYSYEFGTGKLFNLTQNIPTTVPTEIIHREIANMPVDKNYRGLNFACWGQNNKILIYDEFDIWEVDINGESSPINITNGFGRKSNTVLRLIGLNSGLYFNKMIAAGQHLILNSFNRNNKMNGSYEIVLGKKTNPKLLSTGNYEFTSSFGIQSPVKAEAKEIYLIQIESAINAPNLYWTNDFKSFRLLSSIYPEKKYNWLTSELKSFKTLDRRTEQAVLYKPQNFDAQKKYPVIIHYYENKSNELNKFHNPGGDFDGGQLDIAWFVSHGYIVFTPDIHYKIGETGKSTYNSIVAAANFLKTLPFINPGKIGIQGHSFGGYETNYLAANSRIFAAAISSSGPSDFIAGYLSDRLIEQFHSEFGQNRLGKSLWEDIPMYIENSPVFKAYNVATPILTVANKADGNVPFTQGLEWYMALRRLGKRVWMLQYDDGGHGVGGRDYIDYITRSTQFFDHYLKDSACPRWMLYGIPAKMKGLDDGLELVREKDKHGKWLTPKEGGLLSEEQKKKVQALQKNK